MPETPIWLLSRGRRDDAVKALCWLRGWVQPDQVQSEFEEIVRYSKTCKITPRMLKKLKEKRSISNIYTNEGIHYNNNVSTTQIHDGPSPQSAFGNDADSYPNNSRHSKPNINTDSFEDQLLNVKVPLKERIIDFCRPEMMKPMFLVTSFFFFLYGSGIWAIRPYMVTVFMELGFELDPFLATVITTNVV